MKFSVLFFLGCMVHLGVLKGQASIQVEVTGISAKKGEILVALFSGEKGFPNDATKAFKTAKATPVNGKAILYFNQIPEGSYAIALFHDTNDDGELNTNVFGIPKEGYGVSNNTRNMFSAPDYEEAVFRHEKSATRLSISVKY